MQAVVARDGGPGAAACRCSSRIVAATAGAACLARACRVTRGTLLWRHPPSDTLGARSFRLHYHPKGYMHITGAAAPRAP